jgi:hypothetical protein
MIAVNQRRILLAVQVGKIPLEIYSERNRRFRDDGDPKSVISSTARNLFCFLHPSQNQSEPSPAKFFTV